MKPPFEKLPVSEYAHCVIEWQMPGELEIFHLEGLDVTAVDYFDDSEYTVMVTWLIDARDCGQPSSTTGCRFIDDYFWGGQDFSIAFSINCSYLCYLPYGADSNMKEAERAALREAVPDFGYGHAFSITVPSCPSYCSSPLEYLKVMDSWMVVAQNLQDDATEFARLQLRFEEAYLLIEVGVKTAVDIVTYALVSLMDEAALLDLFNAQSTHFQFVERERSNGRLPPVEDRFVRISILDLGENRMVKLSEGNLLWRTTNVGDRKESCRITTSCRFECFDEKIEFQANFEEEGGDQYAVMINLSIVYAQNPLYDDIEEDWQEEVCDPSVLLDFWKTMEICMTGGAD